MRTYPIMLDLHGRLAVVVGGGSVGLRKVRSLLRAEATVRLVTLEIDAQTDLTGVEVVREPYHEGALTGAAFVFACTDDRQVNSRVAADARRIGALVNVADTPEECDFYLPATVQDGDVIVAIGTGGGAPAVSGWLKKRIAATMPERIVEFVAALDEIRTGLKDTIAEPERRMATMKQLVSDEMHEAFLRGGPAALRTKLPELLDSQEET